MEIEAYYDATVPAYFVVVWKGDCVTERTQHASIEDMRMQIQQLKSQHKDAVVLDATVAHVDKG